MVLIALHFLTEINVKKQLFIRKFARIEKQ